MADNLSMEVDETMIEELNLRDPCFKISNVIIRNQLSPNKTTFSPAGSKIESTYGLHYDNGKESLAITGETDIYSRIQASLEDTKIYNILKRYTNGDIEALSRTQGQFFDATRLPSSLAEAQHHLMNVSKQFDSLPDSVKKQFNYSVTEYVEKISNGGVPYVSQLLNNNVSIQAGGQSSELVTKVESKIKEVEE